MMTDKVQNDIQSIEKLLSSNGKKMFKVIVQNLKKEVLETQEELQKLQNINYELQSKVNQLQDESKKLKEIIQQLEQDLCRKEDENMQNQKKQRSNKKQREQFTIEQLQEKLRQTEESAIEVIYEKELKIQELQELFQKVSESNGQCSMAAEIQQQRDQMKIQNQQIIELSQQVQTLNDTYFENIKELEQQWNQRLLEAVSQKSNENKSNELELLQQIAHLEEKNQQGERQIYEQEKKFNFEVRELISQITSYEEKINTLEKKIRVLTETNQTLQRELNSQEFLTRKITNQNEDKLNKLLNQIQEANRTNQQLKIQIQRLQNENLEYQLGLEESHRNKEALEQSLISLKNQYEMSLSNVQQRTSVEANQKSAGEYQDQDQITPTNDNQSINLEQRHSNLKDDIVDEKCEISCFLNRAGDSISRRQSEYTRRNSIIELDQMETTPIMKLEDDERLELQKDLERKNELIEEMERCLQEQESYIANLQGKMEITIKELQIQRKRYLALKEEEKTTKQNQELLQDNENLRKLLLQMENHFMQSKYQWGEEKSFLKEEIHYLEKESKKQSQQLKQKDQDIVGLQTSLYDLQSQLKIQKGGSQGMFFSFFK